MSFLFHHRLASGLCLDLGTISWMVSCMDLVSELIASVVCSAFCRFASIGVEVSFCQRFCLKAVQSVVLKLYEIWVLADFCGICSLVIIGK